MNSCPPADQLSRLLTEELPATETAAVEAHLEECVACQEALERLTAGNAFPMRPKQTGGDTKLLRQLEEQLPTASTPRPAQAEQGPEAAESSPAGPNAVTVVRSAGRHSQTAAELPLILRKRLLFSAICTWITYALYALTFLPVFGDRLSVTAFLFMLGVASMLVLVLRRRRPLSLRQLRAIEVVLFFSMGLYFTWVQLRFHSFDWLSRMAELGWQGVWLMARAFTFAWFAMIVFYGILIPNTWLRCAVVVGVMAVWAVLLNVAAGFWEATVAGPLRGLFIFECAVNMALAAALATYGAHRIEVLRAQAAEARKLGQYQLKRRLGSGGMGEVYLAEHVLLRRPCALKLIHPQRAADAQYLHRFEREVQVMATLSHPNTVEIFDYGHAEDGTFYYVMEYLPGLTVEELVQGHGPLPPQRAVHLLRQVCGALAEAHGVGLIHRDVKPGNIMVCARGGLHDIAKLLDFGLVHVLGPGLDSQKLTQDGMIAGTPAYMSPEQATGCNDLDARSDLYSLGAVAYFLVTGQPPFLRPSAVQTLAAHLSEAVPAPNSLCPDLPDDLQRIILRCLEKDPARRFPDAAALEHALGHCATAGCWTSEKAVDWWRQLHDSGASRRTSCSDAAHPPRPASAADSHA